MCRKKQIEVRMILYIPGQMLLTIDKIANTDHLTKRILKTHTSRIQHDRSHTTSYYESFRLHRCIVIFPFFPQNTTIYMSTNLSNTHVEILSQNMNEICVDICVSFLKGNNVGDANFP